MTCMFSKECYCSIGVITFSENNEITKSIESNHLGLPQSRWPCREEGIRLGKATQRT